MPCLSRRAIDIGRGHYASDRSWPILLKNASALLFDFVQGVVGALTDRRSSILGDSEGSIFLRDGSQTVPTEFFNRIGRKRTSGAVRNRPKAGV